MYAATCCWLFLGAARAVPDQLNESQTNKIDFFVREPRPVRFWAGLSKRGADHPSGMDWVFCQVCRGWAAAQPITEAQ